MAGKPLAGLCADGAGAQAPDRRCAGSESGRAAARRRSDPHCRRRRPGAAGAAPVDPTLVPVAFLRTAAARRGPRAIPEGAALARPEDRASAARWPSGVAVEERGAAEPARRRVGSQAPSRAFLMPGDGGECLSGHRAHQPGHSDAGRGLAAGPPRHDGHCPRSTHVALTLSVDPELRQRLILIPSIVALLSIIAMGVIVFTARRE